MTPAEAGAKLGGITCTAPFTLTDAAELFALVKSTFPNAYVDVYWTRGDVVHVCVDGVLVRDLPIV